MSAKMLANVFHIFSNPKIPPPTIAPIAMNLTALLNAYIWTAPVSYGYTSGFIACNAAGKSWRGMFAPN